MRLLARSSRLSTRILNCGSGTAEAGNPTGPMEPASAPVSSFSSSAWEGRTALPSAVWSFDSLSWSFLMMGNDQLNESKLQTALGSAVRPSHADELKLLTGADAGSIGPVGLPASAAPESQFKILVDKRLERANNLISGANKNDYHLGNIDLARDVKVDAYHDLRIVQKGEPCPGCGNPL